eukprot:scaffold64773_cov25-Tisochrysis_lutea.AAC.1
MNACALRTGPVTGVASGLRPSHHEPRRGLRADSLEHTRSAAAGAPQGASAAGGPRAASGSWRSAICATGTWGCADGGIAGGSSGWPSSEEPAAVRSPVRGEKHTEASPPRLTVAMCQRTRLAHPRRPRASSHEGDSVTRGSTQDAKSTGRFVVNRSSRQGSSHNDTRCMPAPAELELTPSSPSSAGDAGESTIQASSTVRSEPADQNHETALSARPRESEGESSARSSKGLQQPPSPIPTSAWRKTSQPKIASSVAVLRPCVSASSPKAGVERQEPANEAEASSAASSGNMPKASPAQGGRKASRFVCSDCATTNSPIAGIVSQWKRPKPIRSSIASTSIGRSTEVIGSPGCG